MHLEDSIRALGVSVLNSPAESPKTNPISPQRAIRTTIVTRGTAARIGFNLKRRRVLLACGTLLGARALPAWAEGDADDPAVARIRAFYASLLGVMKQGKELGIRGRFEKLAPAILATFDLAAMTRIAVGPDWKSIASDQQVALVDNFSRMTIATYANRFDAYSGQRFEVEPAAEVRSTGRVVHTKLIPASGEATVLNYLMRGSGTEWKVVDVHLTGTISELATRRSEFAAILKSGGPNALLESLRQQADKLMRSPA